MGGVLTPLTFSLNKVWAAGARARALKPYKLEPSVPVVGVGNLQVGGTGKTPTIAKLSEVLTERGLRPGIVSRGYGRKSRMPRLVGINDAADLVGDEPLMLRRRGHIVAVADSRIDAYHLLQEQGIDIDILLLDDAFLQRDIRVDHHVLMWDSCRPGSEHCLPYGNLRAPLAMAVHADTLIRQGNCAVPPVADSTAILNAHWQLPVLRPLSGNLCQAPCENLTVLVAAGVGNPGSVNRIVQEMGFRTHVLAMEDHTTWDRPSLRRVQAYARKIGAFAVVVTEKDAVKIGKTEVWPNTWVLEADWHIEALEYWMDNLLSRWHPGARA